MVSSWLVLFWVLVIECVVIGLLFIDYNFEVCLVWLCIQCLLSCSCVLWVVILVGIGRQILCWFFCLLSISGWWKLSLCRVICWFIVLLLFYFVNWLVMLLVVWVLLIVYDRMNVVVEINRGQWLVWFMVLFYGEGDGWYCCCGDWVRIWEGGCYVGW